MVRGNDAGTSSGGDANTSPGPVDGGSPHWVDHRVPTITAQAALLAVGSNAQRARSSCAMAASAVVRWKDACLAESSEDALTVSEVHVQGGRSSAVHTVDWTECGGTGNALLRLGCLNRLPSAGGRGVPAAQSAERACGVG